MTPPSTAFDTARPEAVTEPTDQSRRGIHFQNGLHAATVRHLAHRLSEAETSLDVLTRGAVDAIVDSAGQAYLLRAAQERFRQNGSHIQTLLDSAPDVIMAISHSGEILFHSAAATRLLGYDGKELVGQNMFEFVRSADARQLHHTLFGVMEQFSVTAVADFHLLVRDGSWRLFEASIGLLTDPSQSQRLILILRDPERRREDLEEALRQKIAAETERFLARFALELQRPLALALLGLDALDDAPYVEAKPILEVIRHHLERQSRLLEELLEVTNTKNGGAHPKAAVEDFGE